MRKNQSTHGAIVPFGFETNVLHSIGGGEVGRYVPKLAIVLNNKGLAFGSSQFDFAKSG